MKTSIKIQVQSTNVSNNDVGFLGSLLWDNLRDFRQLFSLVNNNNLYYLFVTTSRVIVSKL